MEIFRNLNKLGYKHYLDYTVEELDSLNIKSKEFSIESNLAFDWFREKYNTHIAVISYTNPAKIEDKLMFEILIGNKENLFDPSIDNSLKRLKESFEDKEFSYYNLYNSYEEAREQAILKTIELCQK